MKLRVCFLLMLTLKSKASQISNGGVIYAAAPNERGAYHVGGVGTYNYGYNTGDGIAKVEVRHSDGSVTGSYRYFDPSGRQIVRSYIADSKGFRVLGNDLPTSPNTPAIGILDAQTLTGVVEGTQDFDTPNIVTADRTPLLFSGSNQAMFNSLRRGSGDKFRSSPTQFRWNNFLRPYLTLQQPSLQQRIDTRSGYVQNVFGVDSPYFFARDNINYDFPAGFAYTAVPVLRLAPIGVKGRESKQKVAAGHTNGRNRISSTRFRTTFPFVVGHKG